MKTMESLITSFVEGHPKDAAVNFEKMDVEDAVRILGKIPLRAVGQLLQSLTPHKAAAILSSLDSNRRRELLSAMNPRQASSVLNHVEQSHREEVLGNLPDAMARQLRELLEYPADTAGGMMEPRVASIPSDLTAQAAIGVLRKAPRQALYYLYVTDRDGKLMGVLNMRDLMLAPPHSRIETLIRRPVQSVPSNMDRQEVLNLMRKNQFIALPVVDMDERLIGVIKHDEALKASQLEAFEDLQKMVGAGGDERALSPVSTVVKRRLPWLYVNLLTAFLAAAVVGVFEGVIQQVTALAVLLPIVSGQGGNTGAQSLAVVMRGIVLRELLPSSTRKVLIKETLGGLFNGLAVAALTSAAVWIWSRNVWLAVVIGLAMIVNMAIAGLAGAAIPIILKALKQDPAQSSSIFLTTVTDCVGFAAFLGFALLFLPFLVG